MTATIPQIPKTNNASLRSHWGARQRETTRWRRLVRTCCGTPGYGMVQGRQRVTITVHRGRRQDKDNAYGSVKPIVDGLKRAGWVVDDAPEWIDLRVQEEVERDRRKRRTVIEVERCQTTSD